MAIEGAIEACMEMLMHVWVACETFYCVLSWLETDAREEKGL